jgi:dihydroxy-acid dehydratase
MQLGGKNKVEHILAEDGKPINRRSAVFTEGYEHPAARAMLFGSGLTNENANKAQIAIAHMGYEQNNCNMHLEGFARTLKEHTNKSDKLFSWIFGIVGISDGITMGTPGMRSSLPSREWIADAIEGHVYAHPYDALVAIPGCDKNMPGSVIAMARLNIPSIMVYGGTIRGGCHNDEALNIVSSFEAKGKFIKGLIDEDELVEVIENSCPGQGACGGMYTANTMSSAIEALGLSLPNSSSMPADSKEKQKELEEIPKYLEIILEKNIKPLDILTKKAFENAITLIMVLGGSTNAVLHMIAIGKAAGVDITVEDFKRISAKTPLLADMKPSGKYLMEDLFEVGGVQAVLKYLYKNNMIHGDCLTVTGKTIAENLEDAPDLAEGQDVIMPLEKPIKKDGHIKILFGNLAPTSAVAKITGKEGTRFSGPAKVYENEIDAINGLKKGEIVKGDVVIIRNEGPKGAPGMPEMLDFTSAVMGAGMGKDLALITDGRFSGGSHGFVIGHVTPESYVGGPIALVKNGDKITIDSEKLTIDMDVSEEDLEKRKSEWTAPEPKYKHGLFAKIIRDMRQANEGAVTDI